MAPASPAFALPDRPIFTETADIPVALLALRAPVARLALRYPVALLALWSPVALLALRYPVALLALWSPVALLALRSPVALLALRSPVALLALWYPVACFPVADSHLFVVYSTDAGTKSKIERAAFIDIDLATRFVSSPVSGLASTRSTRANFPCGS